MVRRSDHGTWGLPGGGVEAGETWEQAALRECLEETGWDVTLTGLLGLCSEPDSQVHRYPDGHVVHFYGAVFLAAPLSSAGTRDGEATDVQWRDLDALPEPLLPTDAPVRRDVAFPPDRPIIR